MPLEQKGRRNAPKVRSSGPAPSRFQRPPQRSHPTPGRFESVPEEAAQTPPSGAPLLIWRWFERHDLAFSCVVACLACAAVALLAYAAHFVFQGG